MQTQSKNTEFHEFVFSQVSKFDEFQSNIINIPLFALSWGWIHVYLYLGPSDIHHVHVMHLDLNNLRHFQVVRKQLVKVVWRALNFVLRRWFATMAEFFRGKGWFLKLSRVSILHSIMLNFDWVYDKHFVYRGKTKHLWQALTNGLHAAIVKIWELARGKWWLVMRSWF